MHVILFLLALVAILLVGMAAWACYRQRVAFAPGLCHAIREGPEDGRACRCWDCNMNGNVGLYHSLEPCCCAII